MLFEQYIPDDDQAEFVQCFIYYKGFQPEHQIERVVPDGSIYLIFELDGYTRHVFDNDSLEPTTEFRACWLSGAHTEYLSISAHEDSEMFVIQFKPAGAVRLLQSDVSRFSNQVIPAADLFSNATLTLRLELLAARTPTDKFECARRFLSAHCREKDSVDTIVTKLVAAIQENSTSKLKDLIADAGYSQKQLIHHFKQRVGLTPKAFQRIVRFNELLPKIMEQKTVAWNKISVECDYFDQSHFIKEFKRFCGYSPGQFLVEQQDHDAVNFFPLTEE